MTDTRPPASRNLVTTDWLAARLGKPGIAVVDGSFYLPALKRDARAEFLAAHIPGAVLKGPASSPEGLGALTTWGQSLPKNANVVIYCGCCPWDHCRNVGGAYAALVRLEGPLVRAHERGLADGGRGLLQRHAARLRRDPVRAAPPAAT